jgi:hypothetical protein
LANFWRQDALALAVGWSTVLIYFLLLLGFGSFLIAKPRGV